MDADSKKRLLIVPVVLVIMAGTWIFHYSMAEENISEDQIACVSEVEKHYDMILNAVIRLRGYAPGDCFAIAGDEAVEVNSALVKGDLVVYHKSKTVKANFAKAEWVDDAAIKAVFKHIKVKEIRVGEQAIDFIRSEPDAELLEESFDGFYYSVNRQPQIVRYYEEGTLEKLGKTWYCGDESGWYDTEKIKGRMYYYEGMVSFYDE